MEKPTPKEEQSKLREQQTRGSRAEEILKDPLIQQAFDKMRGEIRGAWESSKIDEVDVREDCFRMECLIKRFESAFRQLVAEGKYAGNLLSSTKDE